jgi:hypothetical protein
MVNGADRRAALFTGRTRILMLVDKDGPLRNHTEAPSLARAETRASRKSLSTMT